VPLLLIFASGCIKIGKTPEPTTPTPVPKPQPPKIDYAKFQPNELGHIPVLMYHDIGKTGKNRADGLDRTIASFEEDLQLLYDKGFYPVNISAILDNRIDVPMGKTPVAITFDDARKTQFNLLESTAARQVDPSCALGIMERFIKTHPDWKLRATFFILPKSKVTNESFGQTGLGKDKIKYLIDSGMEIGNHSTLHKRFTDYKAADIQREIGEADQLITTLNPEVKIQAFAVPMGTYPRDKTLWPYLSKGAFNNKQYAYKASFDAAWRPIFPPGHKKYNPLRLERINCIDSTNGVRYWINKLSLPGGSRYVSDGDPSWVSFPISYETEVDRAQLTGQGVQVNAYQSAAQSIQSAADAPAPTQSTAPAITPAAPPITGNR
jgi:peptidoglycan/xylan/chitin deacetylase (PgdA/CDA1 family)